MLTKALATAAILAFVLSVWFTIQARHEDETNSCLFLAADPDLCDSPEHAAMGLSDHANITRYEQARN